MRGAPARSGLRPHPPRGAPPTDRQSRVRGGGLALPLIAAVLAGCAGTPVPDWQLEAYGSLERANDAYLSGNTRVAALEYERARAAVARTARVDLAARVELSRCAAQVASLDFAPCTGFERLRADAAPAEQAYADYLLGTLAAARAPLLPAAQQAAATAASGDLAPLQAIADPLSRLVAAGVALRTGRATPAAMNLAAETASAQGWRRPLLAWLRILQERAEAGGDRAEAERIARRIDLLPGPSTSKGGTPP